MDDRAGTPKTDQVPGWTSPIAVGLLIGAVFGVGEVVVRWLGNNPAINRATFPVACVLYAGAGAVVGTILLVCSAGLRRSRPSRALSSSVIVGFFAFVVTAGTINVRYLPSATAPSSLAVTGLLVVGFVGLGIVLFRLLDRLGKTRLGTRLSGRRLTLTAWIVGIALAAGVGFVGYLPLEGSRPVEREVEAVSDTNALLIIIDALRADHLSAYGYERETTPVIDRWAKEEILFENAFAQASWTKPATATLLTGLYPSAHGVNLVQSCLPRNLRTLPEIMKENGYRTGIFSDNCLVSPLFGFQRGVDVFVVQISAGFHYLTLGRIVGVFKRKSPVVARVVKRMTVLARHIIGQEAMPTRLGIEGLTDAFFRWLDKKPEGPFFAYVHCTEPHAPYSPAPPFDTTFLRADLRDGPRVTWHPKFWGFLPFDRAPAVSADSLQNMIALYDGEIAAADSGIGVLLDGLKERGIYENTLILLTSDHGEEFYEHGGWDHGHSLYQELLWVPLILSCPRVAADAPNRIPHAVRHIDIFPTILEVCGVALPEGIDGASLLPILRGLEPPEPSRPVMSEVYHAGHFARALLSGHDKVILSQRGQQQRLQLFNLSIDPGETENLADLEKGRVGEMLARLDEFHAIASSRAAAGYTVTIDEHTRDRLKALGYIQ